MKKLLLCLLLAFSAFSWAQQEPSGYPQQFEGDWNVPDFTFHSGEKLAQLRLHYITLGSPVRDGTGHVGNAILILHGTGVQPATTSFFRMRSGPANPASRATACG